MAQEAPISAGMEAATVPSPTNTGRGLANWQLRELQALSPPAVATGLGGLRQLSRHVSDFLPPPDDGARSPNNPPAMDSASWCSEKMHLSHEFDLGSSGLQLLSIKKSWGQIHREGGLGSVCKFALHSAAFDNAMCLIVLANAVCMAVEQAQRLAGEDTAVVDKLEYSFLAFYCLELAMNFYAFRAAAWRSHWVKFDVLLVFTGLASTLVTLVASEGIAGGRENPLMKMMVLRMVRLLRLARLARTLRVFSQCQELWMLARGLLNSFSTAFHTLMFGAVLLFVVGCMAVELLPLTMLRDGTAESNEVVKSIIEDSFNNLPNTMLTLVQFMTFDNVVYIYKPLIEEDPTLALFFMVVLLLVGVVFMNLVTAIIVNSGLEQTLADKNMKKLALEQQRRQLLVELEKAFHRMDTNCSGTLCRSELCNIDSESLAVLERYLGLENLPQMFDVLDVESTGEIGIGEFCNGITAIVLTETQPEVVRIERLAESLSRTMRRCEAAQAALAENLDGVVTAVHRMQRCLDKSESSTELESEAETEAPPEQVVSSPWEASFLEELREMRQLLQAPPPQGGLAEEPPAAGPEALPEAARCEATCNWPEAPRQPAQSVKVPSMLRATSPKARGARGSRRHRSSGRSNAS